MHDRIRFVVAALILMSFGSSCTVMNAITCASQGGEWILPGQGEDPRNRGYCKFDKDDPTQPDDDPAGSDNDVSEGDSASGGESANNAAEDENHSEGQPAPATMDDPTLCNAWALMDITVSEAQINDDENETRCKYTITYTNRSDTKLWVFLHKIDKGPKRELEETWNRYYKLDPRESLTLNYQTLLYKESGFKYIDVVLDLAAIVASDSCINTFRHDIAPRERIKVPVEVPCSDP